MRKTFAPALLLAISACSGAPEKSETGSNTTSGTITTVEASPTAESGPSLASAPPEFTQCVSCHSIKPGVNAVGPSLFGVYGKKSGSVTGYAYSDANKNSGLTWDDATLDEYLTAPMKKVPGTKMTFAGIPDAAKRKVVIEYLKTLK